METWKLNTAVGIFIFAGAAVFINSRNKLYKWWCKNKRSRSCWFSGTNKKKTDKSVMTDAMPISTEAQEADFCSTSSDKVDLNCLKDVKEKLNQVELSLKHHFGKKNYEERNLLKLKRKLLIVSLELQETVRQEESNINTQEAIKAELLTARGDLKKNKEAYYQRLEKTLYQSTDPIVEEYKQVSTLEEAKSVLEKFVNKKTMIMDLMSLLQKKIHDYDSEEDGPKMKKIIQKKSLMFKKAGTQTSPVKHMKRKLGSPRCRNCSSDQASAPVAATDKDNGLARTEIAIVNPERYQSEEPTQPLDDSFPTIDQIRNRMQDILSRHERLNFSEETIL